MKKTMKMTATGDSILIQGYPEEGYPGFEEICDYIAKGDARFGNLESTVTEFDTYAAAESGGTWMNASPEAFWQLTDFGFNFLGFANNHTLDFGPDGLLETLDYVRDSGVSLAGAGEDLAKASEPAYRTFQSGRVAFIAVSASFNAAARAGDQTKTLPGRPGLNPLRKNVVYYVNSKHFKAVREIAKASKINGIQEISIRNGFTPKTPAGVAKLGPVSFRECNDKPEGKYSSCNKRDLARIKSAIKDAKVLADYVVVMLHDHDIKADVMSEPDDAAKEFAHFCIDNGVSAVFGGGTHELKPLEIYKGKPIFYSLGNFCFQSNLVLHQPADLLDKFGYSDMSDVMALAKRNGYYRSGLHANPENFRTVIPYLEFENGKMTKLEMKPVELGFKKTRTEKGLPYPATKEQAKEIFAILKKLSAPYGTNLVLREDGIIELVK